MSHHASCQAAYILKYVARSKGLEPPNLLIRSPDRPKPRGFWWSQQESKTVSFQGCRALGRHGGTWRFPVVAESIDNL